jgi:hypothetical protein
VLGRLMTTRARIERAPNKPELARGGMSKADQGDYSCAICLEIALRAHKLVSVECTCEIRLCRECAHALISRGHMNCPTCRSAVTGAVTNSDIDRKVSNLRYACFCPIAGDARCKNFEGAFEDLLLHLGEVHVPAEQQAFEKKLLELRVISLSRRLSVADAQRSAALVSLARKDSAIADAVGSLIGAAKGAPTPAQSRASNRLGGLRVSVTSTEGAAPQRVSGGRRAGNSSSRPAPIGSAPRGVIAGNPIGGFGGTPPQIPQIDRLRQPYLSGVSPPHRNLGWEGVSGVGRGRNAPRMARSRSRARLRVHRPRACVVTAARAAAW